jgi:hypothetical protein
VTCPRFKVLKGVLVRNLAIPAGWRFTRNTHVLYLQEPRRAGIDKQRRSWNVERFVPGGRTVHFGEGVTSKTGDHWTAVLVDEELQTKTEYRLRRGLETSGFPEIG